MKLHGWALAVLVAALFCQAPAAGADPIPAGWALFDTKPPDEASQSCAAYSPLQWDVTVADSAVRIRPFEGRPQRCDPLPFLFEPKGHNLGCESDRHVVRVNDGWLIGCDAGEF